MSRPATPMQFLSVKAFGDFAIAVTAIERTARAAGDMPSILAADHLRALSIAMGPACRIDFVGNGEPGVPAIFDVRRAGVFAAARSAVGLKRAVARARDRATVLAVDKAGWRERWLAPSAGPNVLPAAANIYDAYATFLAAAGIGPGEPGQGRAPRDPAVVGIFPGSRVAGKNLPIDLVRSVLAAVEKHGRSPRLYLLDGERPDLERSGIPFTKVERNFEALIAALAAAGSVIGADSLPVHLAERAGLPVFVVSPRPNIYWLPHSSFVHDRWALFEAALERPLHQFLDVT